MALARARTRSRPVEKRLMSNNPLTHPEDLRTAAKFNNPIRSRRFRYVFQNFA